MGKTSIKRFFNFNLHLQNSKYEISIKKIKKNCIITKLEQKIFVQNSKLTKFYDKIGSDLE